MDAVQAAQLIPPYGNREVVVLLSSLTTCDPGVIGHAIKAAQASNLRVNIVGLSAEMYISQKIATDTEGTYRVAISEDHLEELVMQMCLPPPVQLAHTLPNLVRMAFPDKDADSITKASFVGDGCAVDGGAFTCPVCHAKNATIPCDCHVCGITLISSPHLARSYHHLFPIPVFEELAIEGLEDGAMCAFCRVVLRGTTGMHALQSSQLVFKCPRCRLTCCTECDEFVHDHLHNCPGCEAAPIA